MQQNRTMLRQKLFTVPASLVLSLLLCAILALGFLLVTRDGTRVTFTREGTSVASVSPDGTRVTGASPDGIRVNGSPDGIRVN